MSERSLRSAAPVSTGSVLAVLPFRYRGPPADAYLAEAFAEELVDVLSRTASLRVLSIGAVERFAEERDPANVRREVGAEVIVDATLQRAGAKLRIGVRLVDATSGVQLWSEQFSGVIEESFELQETMSRRIAEALRVELSVRSTSGVVPAEAVELCLRARQRLRDYRLVGPDGAQELLRQCLALAPNLAPAIAANAIAALRTWFLPLAAAAVSEGRDAEAKAAVAAALSSAPALAETHFAAGLLALHLGELTESVARLNRALAIAPHYPDALSLLGALECEIGRTERGRERLELAWALSPDVTTTYALALHYALHGRYDDFDRVMSRSDGLRDSTGLLVLDIRVASWRRDDARLTRGIERLAGITHGEASFEAYSRVLLRKIPFVEADERFSAVASSPTNMRARALLLQLGAEAFALHGEVAFAERYLTAAAESSLLDLDWLERCPVLAPLRGSPAYAAARNAVAARTRAIREG